MSAEQDVYIETHLNGFVLDIEEGCQANGAKPDGSFLIVSKLNGKVLDCLDVYIETHLNGFVLDIEGSCQANGAKVISFPRNSPPSPNQQWYFDYQPDRTFLIVSKLNGKVLECVGQGIEEQLIVWDRHGGENQRFRREGNYLVTMRGLVVDVKGSNQAPKTPIIQYSKNCPA
eukprot:Em0002g974a